MCKDLMFYLKFCFRSSFKSSIKNLESLFGSIFSITISFLLFKYYKAIIENLFHDKDTQNYWIWLIGFLLALVIFFIIRLFLIAPFELYRKQKKEIFEITINLQDSRKEIYHLVNCDIADLPFDDAINEVKKLFPDKSYVNIQKHIEVMIINEKMSAWGQPVFSEILPIPEKLIKIPHKFFYSPKGAKTEYQGFSYKVYASHPNWKEYINHKRYVNVCVNHKQLMTVFSNIK